MKQYCRFFIYVVLMFVVGCHSQHEVVLESPEWVFARKVLRSLQTENVQQKLHDVRPFYADLWPQYLKYLEGDQEVVPNVEGLHKFTEFVETIVPNYSFCGDCQELRRKYVTRQKYLLGGGEDCKECSRKAKAHGHPDLPKLFSWDENAYKNLLSLLESNIKRAGFSTGSCEIVNVYSKKLKTRNNIDYLEIVLVLADSKKNLDNHVQFRINVIRSDFGINLLEQ